MAVDSVTTENPKKTATPSLIPTTIAQAIIDIQKTLEPMKKSADNAAYSSKYVPLEEVTKKAHELLSKHKIGVIQSPVTDEQGHAALETILFTGSGQSFSRTTKLAMNKVDPQAHGSAITYTRRYALMAILGLTGLGEDDDGNEASGAIAPVTEDQIREIKMLLSLIPWPKEDIAKAVFALKSRDAAALAIVKYQKLISQKARDEESKANATKIEVGTGAIEEPAGEVEPLSEKDFKRRLKALGLRDSTYEKKVIHAATTAPFLSKVMDNPERIEKLDAFLKMYESGLQRFEADWYAPTTENILVDEKVA